MDTGKIVIGVLAGVAVGALLGVLFAPDKGSETRKKFFKKGSDAIDDLQDNFEGLLSNASEKFDSSKINQKVDNFKHETHGLYEKGKEKVDEIKKDVKAHII